MSAATLLLLAALPALAGRACWCADGEVVVMPEGAGAAGVAGVSFAPRQVTSVVAPLGHAATLDCRVLHLQDKSVSWVRSRDLQILAHAGAVFTADARVSATAGALTIQRLRAADAGRYECQVNTEPKMSLFFNLSVVDEPVPAVVVEALGAARVTSAAGGAATLACEARYSPPPRALALPALELRWRRAGTALTLGGARGARGVALDTERWPWRVRSRLTLADLALDDAGDYECHAGDVAATLSLVLLDTEDRAEAMQRDQASSSASRGVPARRALLAASGVALLQLCVRRALGT